MIVADAIRAEVDQLVGLRDHAEVVLDRVAAGDLVRPPGRCHRSEIWMVRKATRPVCACNPRNPVLVRVGSAAVAARPR